MKRVLILLPILILAVSVAACGGETTTTGSTPADEGAAEVSVWYELRCPECGELHYKDDYQFRCPE